MLPKMKVFQKNAELQNEKKGTVHRAGSYHGGAPRGACLVGEKVRGGK